MYSQSYDVQLWNSMKARYASAKLSMLESGQLTINDKTMKFQYKKFGNRPQNGYNLVFGFHGGGGCPKQVNDGQYNNHKNLYNNQLPDGTIWFTPRSIQDVWDMWFKNYMEDFILQIIRAFALNDLIDINKVFITGYSAGGDGTYHMAPRLADHLAGAAMMAGHPNGINLMNIRNIGFSIQLGGEDNAYNRKNEAIKYIRMLNQLGQNYGGFEHQSKIHEGKPHWMNLKDAQVFKWLFSRVRDPYPNVILYKQTPRRTKQQFYYIRIGKSLGGDKTQQVLVFKQGNNFTIFSNRTITILLNRKMVNPNQYITVVHNGQKTGQKILQMRKQIAQKTLLQRIDPHYIFEDQIVSNPPVIIKMSQAICEQFAISQEQKQAQYEPSLDQDSNNTPADFSYSLQPLAKRRFSKKPRSLHQQQIVPQVMYYANQLPSQRPNVQFQYQQNQASYQQPWIMNQPVQPIVGFNQGGWENWNNTNTNLNPSTPSFSSGGYIPLNEYPQQPQYIQQQYIPPIQPQYNPPQQPQYNPSVQPQQWQKWGGQWSGQGQGQGQWPSWPQS